MRAHKFRHGLGSVRGVAGSGVLIHLYRGRDLSIHLDGAGGGVDVGQLKDVDGDEGNDAQDGEAEDLPVVEQGALEIGKRDRWAREGGGGVRGEGLEVGNGHLVIGDWQ